MLIKLVDVSPLAVSSGRSIIAVSTLILITGRVPTRPSLAVTRCGILYALTVTTFVAATKLTTAANAIVIQYTAPIFVALLSWRFLGERVTRKDWIAVAIVMIGMTIFFADGLTVGNNLGNLIALLSGISFASLVISLRQIHNQNPVDAIIIGNSIAFVIGLPWLLSSSWSIHSIIGVMLLGIFQLGLSYYFYTKAIPHVSALEAVLIPVLEPILNPVWVFFVMGESPTPIALGGAGVILTAVTWRALVRLHQQRAIESKQRSCSKEIPSAAKRSSW